MSRSTRGSAEQHDLVARRLSGVRGGDRFPPGERTDRHALEAHLGIRREGGEHRAVVAGAHRLVEPLDVLGQHQTLSRTGYAGRGPAVSVALDQHAFDPDVSFGRTEAHRHSCPHALDGRVGVDPDYRVVRAGHPRVGDRRRPAWLHAGVVRLHVRVRPHDRGHASVQPPGHRDLLARRLGVEVEEDDLRATARLLDELVHDLERALGRREEQPAEQVEDSDRRAVDGRLHCHPCAGRLARQVRRADHALGLGEVRGNLHPPPDVIAERDHVGACGENSIRELRGQSGPVGRVLAVHDAEIDLELLLQAREPLLDRASARRAEHVREKEDLHREGDSEVPGPPLAAAGAGEAGLRPARAAPARSLRGSTASLRDTRRSSRRSQHRS